VASVPSESLFGGGRLWGRGGGRRPPPGRGGARAAAAALSRSSSTTPFSAFSERGMGDTVIVLSSDDDDEAAASSLTRAGCSREDAVELSDDENPPSTAVDPPRPPAKDAGTQDAPLVLGEDGDEDPEAARAKRQRLAAAACQICLASQRRNSFTLAECGHKFCRNCLSSFVDRKLRRVLASEVACPTCSAGLTISDVQTLSSAATSSTPSLTGNSGVPAHVAAAMQWSGVSPAALGLSARTWNEAVSGAPSHQASHASSSSTPAGPFARPAGTPVATKRLMKELQQIRKVRARLEEALLVGRKAHTTLIAACPPQRTRL
jgi:hypothetical protein